MGDRKTRLAYLFPGIPAADAEKMTKEFLDAFDVEGFIPTNFMGRDNLQRMYDAAVKKIQRAFPRNDGSGDVALLRFNALMNDYLQNVSISGEWSPSRAKEFADQIAIEFPYLVADLPPLISGTYATATRQELWAEAILLFSSPDSKLKAKYLTPEIEAFIAYAFGLKPDKDPNTPYQKPWAPRALASSRVRRLQMPVRLSHTNFAWSLGQSSYVILQ